MRSNNAGGKPWDPRSDPRIWITQLSQHTAQNSQRDIYKRLTSLCQQTQVSLVSGLCLYETQPSRMTLAREKSNRIYWSTLRPIGGKRSRTKPTVHTVGAKPTNVNHEIKQCGRKTMGSSQWSLIQRNTQLSQHTVQNSQRDIYKRLTSLCQQTQVSLVSGLCLYETQPSRMTLAREKSNRIYWSTLRPIGGKRSRTKPTNVGAKPTNVNHEIKQCGRKTLGSSQWSTYLNHSAFAAHCSKLTKRHL